MAELSTEGAAETGFVHFQAGPVTGRFFRGHDVDREIVAGGFVLLDGFVRQHFFPLNLQRLSMHCLVGSIQPRPR